VLSYEGPERAAGGLGPAFAYVESHRQAAVDGLFRLLRQPSISTLGIGLEECAQLLADEMRRIGLDARILPTEGSPIVFAERRVPGARRTLLLYGHYDVQPVEPLELWESPPFEPAIRNGRIYARGSGDNKGQHFAHLKAIEAILATAGELPLTVKVLLDGEEEKGSPNLAAFVAAHRDLLAADYVYTSDGPYHASGRPTIRCGVRGILFVQLEARGPNRDLHSGNWGGNVPNPAWRLVQLLAAMKGPDEHVRIPGFYDEVVAPTGVERELMRGIPLDEAAICRDLGLTTLAGEPGLGYYERMFFNPTLNINGLGSGYVGAGSKTIIPATASARLDIRLVPNQDPDVIADRIGRFIESAGFGDVTYRPMHRMWPSKTPADHPYTDAIARAVRTGFGEPPIVYPLSGGSLPDYVFTRILGLPSVLVPYANPDENNHSPNENLDVESFFKGIRTTIAVLHEVASL
jgi:acetylornithine deacetylase/succinyl-diaminopimelate desuccinylase-like protein